jgi:hypothetical protein
MIKESPRPDTVCDLWQAASTEQSEWVSLTDMWLADGRRRGRSPAQWARGYGAGFVDHVTRTIMLGNPAIRTTIDGDQVYTWGHWQLGMAYATWLDPAAQYMSNMAFLNAWTQRSKS